MPAVPSHAFGHVDSYYAAAASSAPRRSALAGERSCEACVIGGGLTGVSAALNLAERGIDTVLVEARRIGWGASGRNGGQALVGFAVDVDRLERLVGLENALALWRLTLEGIAAIECRSARHRIACDLKRGYLLAATRRRNLAAHAAWLDKAARRYGYRKYRLLDPDAARREVATDRYHGGLLDEGSLHLHPLAYCLGLAQAAAAAGAVLHEGSPAVRIDPGPPITVETANGAVRARHLVLAGNAYLGRLSGMLRPRIMPVASYVCATNPLGRERARGLIANDIAVCDDRHVLDYFRLTPDYRLLFGAAASFSAREPASLARFVRRRMLRVFPQLVDVGVDYAWSGRIAVTRNRFPDIGRLAPDIYYAHGFSGHGLALTGIAGRVIAEAIAGEPRGLELFAAIPHRPFPGGGWLRMPLLVLAQAPYRLLDAI